MPFPERRVSDDVEKRSRQCLVAWNAVSTVSDVAVVKSLQVAASRNTDEQQLVSGVKSSVPDAHLEALLIIGVQLQAIGEMRSNGIRHRPMLFDGITLPKMKTATSLSVDYGAIPTFGTLNK